MAEQPTAAQRSELREMVYGEPYFPTSKAIPNISASSSVILTRCWVISGRITPDAYFDPRYQEPGDREY